MPLIWITIGYFGGLAAANSFSISVNLWWALFISTTVFILMWRLIVIRLSVEENRARLTTLFLGVLIAFAGGGVRFQISLPDMDDPYHVLYHADRDLEMVITGMVSDFPDERDQYVQMEVAAERLRLAGAVRHAEVEGAILVRLPRDVDVQYGDTVVIRGDLETPPDEGDFSYREVLARKQIYTMMTPRAVGVLDRGGGNPLKRVIFAVKSRGMHTVYQLWPDPEASILAGILLGEEGGIAAEVMQDFQDTGTSHIIVISGFNITIVAGFFSALFGRFSKRVWGALAALFGIAIYTILVGADPAVVRAAVMGGLSIFASQIGRRQHGLNAIAGASLIMALVDPQLPWSISFQLSVAATLGLILYGEPFTLGFTKVASQVFPSDYVQRLTQPVSDFILFTLAAQLTTLPLLLYHFQRLSWIAPLANPFILPVQPPIMVLGGASLILGLIWIPLGRLAAYAVFPFMSYTVRVVEFFGEVQGSSFYLGQLSVSAVVLIYGGLFFLTYGGTLYRPLRRQIKPTLLAGVLLMGNMLVWRSILLAPDGYLHLTFLNVGTGNAVLLTAPEGERVLINGGPSRLRLSAGMGRRFSLRDRELDLLVVASPQGQEIGALQDAIEHYPPQQVLWIGAPSPSRAADALRKKIKERPIPLHVGKKGMRIFAGDEIWIEVLSEDPRGGVLLLTYGEFRAVLPFGVSDAVYQDLRYGRDIGHISVLLLADHGYGGSNPLPWITNLNPRLCVVSVAPDDRGGLPSPSLLEGMAGYSLLRTDVHGWIEITTDGRQMWIDVERLP